VLIAGRASQFGLDEMMAKALALGALFGVEGEWLCAESARAAAKPCAPSFPPQFTSMLAGSTGYAMVRCVSARGVSHATNNFFEAAISSRAALDRRTASADTPGAEVFALRCSFIHPDDLTFVCKSVMAMLGKYVNAHSSVLCHDVSSHVRVWDNRLHCFIPCETQLMLQIDPQTHTMYHSVDFTPAGIPEIPLPKPPPFLQAHFSLPQTGRIVAHSAESADLSPSSTSTAEVEAHYPIGLGFSCNLEEIAELLEEGQLPEASLGSSLFARSAV